MDQGKNIWLFFFCFATVIRIPFSLLAFHLTWVLADQTARDHHSNFLTFFGRFEFISRDQLICKFNVAFDTSIFCLKFLTSRWIFLSSTCKASEKIRRQSETSLFILMCFDFSFSFLITVLRIVLNYNESATRLHL